MCLCVAAEQVITQLAGGRSGIERVIYVDPSSDMLLRVQVRWLVSLGSESESESDSEV